MECRRHSAAGSWFDSNRIHHQPFEANRRLGQLKCNAPLRDVNLTIYAFSSVGIRASDYESEGQEFESLKAYQADLPWQSKRVK